MKPPARGIRRRRRIFRSRSCGGLVGAYGGAVGFITGPGGIVSTIAGTAVGTVGGAAVGLGLGFAENFASCRTICEWRYGTMTDNNTCSIPNDKVLYMAAEAANAVAFATTTTTTTTTATNTGRVGLLNSSNNFIYVFIFVLIFIFPGWPSFSKFS